MNKIYNSFLIIISNLFNILNPNKAEKSLASIITSWVRLFFVLVFLVFVIILATTYYNFSSQINSFEMDMFDVIIESMFENVETAMLVKNFTIVRENLDRIRQLDSINEVFLVNHENKIIVADETEKEGNILNYSSLQQALSSGNEIRESIYVDGSAKIRMILPFKNKKRCQFCHAGGNRVLGSLVISFSTVDIISKTQSTFFFFILFFIFFIFLSALFFNRLTETTINKPISKLVQTTKNIAAGNLKSYTKIESPEEIKILSEAINNMSKDILGYIKDIKKGVSEQMQIKSLAGIGEMAAKVAHEVRNPLNIIDGAVHYIKQTHNQNTDINEYLDLIKENITRINNVASELLDITKSQTPVLKRVNIKSLINERIKYFSNLDKLSNIGITLKSSRNIPNIFIDMNQLIQVIDNLIENALDACNGRNDPKIQINLKKISPTPMHNYVSIKIFDNGIGMSKAEQNNIFTPFYTTKSKGTGLGLVIVQNIIKNHMGDIKILSKKNIGTIVSIRLPITY